MVIAWTIPGHDSTATQRHRDLPGTSTFPYLLFCIFFPTHTPCIIRGFAFGTFGISNAANMAYHFRRGPGRFRC